MRPAWFFLACLACALPAQAQMYKCKDAHGVTRYSDKPLPDCAGQAVDIRAQPPISGKLDSYGSDVGSAERDFQKRRIEREHKESTQAQADEAQRKRCASMKAEYQRFSTANRIVTVDGKGERQYMDNAERDARAARMQAQIARECR
jgi:hypothetical protein